MPHALLADKRLSPTARLVAACLLFWSRGKATCWPSNRAIAERAGVSAESVPGFLRQLVRCGWLRRETDRSKPEQRLLILTWLETSEPDTQPIGGGSPATPAPGDGSPATPTCRGGSPARGGVVPQPPKGEALEGEGPSWKTELADPDSPAPGDVPLVGASPAFDVRQVRGYLVDQTRLRLACPNDDLIRQQVLASAEEKAAQLGLDEAGRLQVLALADEVLVRELTPDLDTTPVWGPTVDDHHLAEAFL